MANATSSTEPTPTPVATGPASAIGGVGARTLVIRMPAGMRGTFTCTCGGYGGRWCGDAAVTWRAGMVGTSWWCGCGSLSTPVSTVLSM